MDTTASDTDNSHCGIAVHLDTAVACFAVAFDCNTGHRRSDCSRDSRANWNSDQCVGELVRRALFVKGHFEARLEVDSQEAVADNSLMSCSDAHTEHFVDNILAGNKANNRFPDEVAGVAGHNSHTDSEDMLDNASDALAASNLAAGDVAHNDRAVLVLNHHL